MAQKPKPGPIQEKGKKGYRLHFSYGGKQYRRHRIQNQQTANELQAEVNNRILRYKYSKKPLPEGQSLPDYIFSEVAPKPNTEDIPETSVRLLSELLEEYQRITIPPAKAESTCKIEKIHIQHLKNFIKDKGYQDLVLDYINVGFFNEYKNYRYAKKMKTDTVKKELSTFQCIFGMAVEHGYIKFNVVRDVKREKSQVPNERFRTSEEIEEILQRGNYSKEKIKEIKRFRYLTWDEVDQLIALAENSWLHPILVVFSFSGMRRGELPKLEWRDVDFKNKFLWIRSLKQSNQQQESTRRIPIDIFDERFMKVLTEQKLKTGDNRWVFPNQKGEQLSAHTLGTRFKRLVRSTSFEGTGYHIFRHSLASNLAIAGLDQRLIDTILGHQTESMRRRYQHLFPKQVSQAIRKNIGGNIDG